MHCTEHRLRLCLAMGLMPLLLVACGSTSSTSAPSPASTPAAAAPPLPAAAPTVPAAPPAVAAPARTPIATARRQPLGPPLAARNWNEFRAQAANRLVQAHPDSTYMGPVAEPLLAIPVLEIELNADGSVRRVQVLRHPRQAKDTTQLAIDAVQRAAPYGSMTLLPRPWKWVEVFLFNDDRRFKPRELDH
ncbi:MAG: hypothetical protein IPI03_10950 [Rubrivivax sp.]|nr:hypothetical protein [Rubrivivax sp.]MBK8528565.1 hypothetical protein [Rubrivivax sp.]